MINLFNEETAKTVLKYIESERERIDTNTKLFDIYEGEINKLLDQKIKDDLGEKTFLQAKERKIPVNILRRIVNKLSNIYQNEPRRIVEDGNDSDANLLSEYEKLLKVDDKLNIHNEFFNLYQYALLQLGNTKSIDNAHGKPFIRTIPNHKYLIMNTSAVDPTSPDVVIMFMDPITAPVGNDTITLDIYWVYTDDQFAIYDSRGDIRIDLMTELGQDGTNPVGESPFSYLNRSQNLVMPKIQNDTLDMSLVIPLLLTDTSYIAKFTAFSIIYAIDIDTKKIVASPNAILELKSDTDVDKSPEIGSLKPEGDTDKLIGLITSILSIWLDTKGIRAGSIGSADTQNVASGISKLIDESDITEDRNYQASVYTNFEHDFWNLLFKKYYPFWIEQNLVDNLGTFSPNAHVKVNFAPQTPLFNRADLIKALSDEVTAGFTTKKRAIMQLNPKMTEDEVENLIKEIEDEQPVNVIMTEVSDDKEQDTNEANTSNT